MAINRSYKGGHGRTLNVHAESKGESITQNANWIATGKKPAVPAAVSRARYQQRKQKQQAAASSSAAQTQQKPTSAAQTQQKPATVTATNTVPNKQSRPIVNGKDISKTFTYDPRKKGGALDQVAEQQGFKSKPTVISDSATFSAAVAKSGFIGYRTINPGRDVVTGKNKTAAQFADDLKNSDSFSHNGSGGRVYGAGIYIASTKNPKAGKAPSRAASASAKQESSYYGSSSSKTVALTLDPSAKIGDYKTLARDFNSKQSSIRNKYNGDIGAYAASKGYDAIRHDVGGCDYLVVYNRSKLVIFDN